MSSEKIFSSNAPEPIGLYPHARKVGNLLFLSGVGPRKKNERDIPGVELDEQGNILSYDIEAQCHSVFNNVCTILEVAGSSWNQLVDVYSDWGALNKGVMRIKRTGSGAYDTSYAIGATPKKDEIPEDRTSDIKELSSIREYFFERYGGAENVSVEGMLNKQVNEKASSTEEEDVDLF